MYMIEDYGKCDWLLVYLSKIIGDYCLVWGFVEESKSDIRS